MQMVTCAHPADYVYRNCPDLDFTIDPSLPSEPRWDFDKLLNAATAGTGREAVFLDVTAEFDFEGLHRHIRAQPEPCSQLVSPPLPDGRLLGHPGIAEISERIRARAKSRADESTMRRRKRGVRGRGHGPGRGIPHTSRFEHSSRTSPNPVEHRALPSSEATASSHSSSGRAHRQGDGLPPVHLPDHTCRDPTGAPEAHREGHGLVIPHSRRLLRDGRPTEAEPQSLRLRRLDRHLDLVHEPALDGLSDQHQAKAGGPPAPLLPIVDEGNGRTMRLNLAMNPASSPSHRALEPYEGARLLTRAAAATKPQGLGP